MVPSLLKDDGKVCVLSWPKNGCNNFWHLTIERGSRYGCAWPAAAATGQWMWWFTIACTYPMNRYARLHLLIIIADRTVTDIHRNQSPHEGAKGFLLCKLQRHSLWPFFCLHFCLLSIVCMSKYVQKCQLRILRSVWARKTLVDGIWIISICCRLPLITYTN